MDVLPGCPAVLPGNGIDNSPGLGLGVDVNLGMGVDVNLDSVPGVSPGAGVGACSCACLGLGLTVACERLDGGVDELD